MAPMVHHLTNPSPWMSGVSSEGLCW